MVNRLWESSWVSQQVLISDNLSDKLGLLNELIDVILLKTTNNHVPNDKLANAGIHNKVLQQVVAVVAQAQYDLLVAFCVHIDRVILDSAFALLVTEFSDFEAELLDSIKDAQATRWLTHDHLRTASLDKIAIDLLNRGKDGAKRHRGCRVLQQKSSNDHVKNDWTGVLLLDNQVRGDVEGCLIKVGLAEGLKISLRQEVLQVDSFAESHIDFADGLVTLLTYHLLQAQHAQVTGVVADDLSCQIADLKQAVVVDSYRDQVQVLSLSLER